MLAVRCVRGVAHLSRYTTSKVRERKTAPVRSPQPTGQLAQITDTPPTVARARARIAPPDPGTGTALGACEVRGVCTKQQQPHTHTHTRAPQSVKRRHNRRRSINRAGTVAKQAGRAACHSGCCRARTGQRWARPGRERPGVLPSRYGAYGEGGSRRTERRAVPESPPPGAHSAARLGVPLALLLPPWCRGAEGLSGWL